MRPIFLVVLTSFLVTLSAPALANNVRPSLLGLGYTPYLNETQELPTTPPALPIKDGASNSTAFGLLATNTDLERVMDADMSVSASGGGWGGNVKASLSKEYRENRKQITFAATQQVVRGTVTLPSPIRITAAASNLLGRNPVKYMLSYGTSVIDSVDLGGSAVFLFTLRRQSGSFLRVSRQCVAHVSRVDGHCRHLPAIAGSSASSKSWQRQRLDFAILRKLTRD